LSNDYKVPFDLGAYGFSRLVYHLNQGKNLPDAFSDALIDTIAKFGSLIAEDVIRRFFQGLKALFKDIFGIP
jgi:hypothetical protein